MDRFEEKKFGSIDFETDCDMLLIIYFQFTFLPNLPFILHHICLRTRAKLKRIISAEDIFKIQEVLNALSFYKGL